MDITRSISTGSDDLAADGGISPSWALDDFSDSMSRTYSDSTNSDTLAQMPTALGSSNEEEEVGPKGEKEEPVDSPPPAQPPPPRPNFKKGRHSMDIF